MSTLYFLEAHVPLTKAYTLDTNQTIKQSNYPHVLKFKSHKQECATLKDFQANLVAHAKLGHCLLKGKIKTPLNFTSRAGSTNSNDLTNWVCFDLDGAPFTTPEDFMSGNPALKDLTYVVQYSASQGFGKPGLRAHIFVFLSQPYNVSYLKAWLMSLNLDGSLWAGKIRRALTLSNSGAAIHWPLDITACQNDKLLYIAPPVVGKGVAYSPPTPAIQYVAKRLQSLDVNLIKATNIEQWKKEQRAVLNALRKEKGLETVRPTRIVGTREVQSKPGEATITESWVDAEAGFVRFNINGGDSNAYYHPIDNYEYIDNFKGEPSYLTKEIFPWYYADCEAKRKHASTQPTEKSEIILSVCDKRSAGLWKINWNQNQRTLQLYPAKNENQLADWLMQHGKQPGDFTPQWDFEFNPQNNTIIDVDEQYLNTYVPSQFYRNHEAHRTKPSTDSWPTIRKIVTSIVSNNEWSEVTEHLMNWLAVIFQKRIKTGTCWVAGGTEGTGKGLFINKVLAPLLGSRYVKEITITRLEDQFNGWLEQTLLCFVDEIQVSSSQHRKILSGTLRNWITEPHLDMRNMNQVAYNAKNYTNFIMGSNQVDPVEINAKDRRYNVGEFQTRKLQITEHEVETLIPQELAPFFNYLMTRKADVAQARTVLHTNSRKSVIDAGRSSVDMLADALIDGDISPFLEALPDISLVMEISGNNSAKAVVFDTIIRRELNSLVRTKVSKDGLHRYESRLSRDELFVLFDYCIGNMPVSPNKFTRLLKYKNIETRRMRSTSGDLCYGFVVTWVASPAWCIEHLATPQPIRRVK